MKFRRERVRCLWTGCPNTTARTMHDGDTHIILCEFHLRKLMEYLSTHGQEAPHTSPAA